MGVPCDAHTDSNEESPRGDQILAENFGRGAQGGESSATGDQPLPNITLAFAMDWTELLQHETRQVLEADVSGLQLRGVHAVP